MQRFMSVHVCQAAACLQRECPTKETTVSCISTEIGSAGVELHPARDIILQIDHRQSPASSTSLKVALFGLPALYQHGHETLLAAPRHCLHYTIHYSDSKPTQCAQKGGVLSGGEGQRLFFTLDRSACFLVLLLSGLLAPEEIHTGIGSCAAKAFHWNFPCGPPRGLPSALAGLLALRCALACSTSPPYT
jgi:hypothetical protein